MAVRSGWMTATRRNDGLDSEVHAGKCVVCVAGDPLDREKRRHVSPEAQSHAAWFVGTGCKLCATPDAYEFGQNGSKWCADRTPVARVVVHERQQRATLRSRDPSRPKDRTGSVWHWETRH